PQSFIQLDSQRQRPRSQLRGRAANRIRGLPRMSPLHPPAATPTASHVNAKFNPFHSRFGDFRLILGNDLPLFHSPSAVRTLLRQRHPHSLVGLSGNRPATPPPVLVSWFASGFSRMSFGFPA